MEDKDIVQLYWERKEQAIPETSAKYGSYCRTIAGNILGNPQDAEECVNDTYLQAWNAIPPHQPKVLSTFLGKITRNLALNRYKKENAKKRGGGQVPLVLEELAEVISDQDSVERKIERQELIGAINDFLQELPRKKRRIFLCRYWYFDRVADIGIRFGMTENQVSVTLHRLRVKLQKHLAERGFEL